MGISSMIQGTKSGLCNNLEVGGRVKREGTYVYLWLIHADIWQKSTWFFKAIILPLKSKLEKDASSMFYLFFRFNLIFNWRIISLQYSHGFCHTSTWIGHRHKRSLPHKPPSPSHPSRLSQSTSFGFPACLIFWPYHKSCGI